MAEEHEDARDGRSTWHVLLGVAFILGGLTLLAERAGWLDIGPLWQWWPLILIGLGLARLLFDRSEDRVDGIWLLAAGIYCGVGVWRPYGLSWATGWPVMVVALGVTLLLENTSFGGCKRPRRRGERGGDDSTFSGQLHSAPANGKETRHGE